MTNGDRINSLAEFEKHLRTYRNNDDQWGLMEFTARCVYQQSETQSACQKDCKGRLQVLENSGVSAKKAGGVAGGIVTGIAAAIYFVVQLFK